MGVLATSSWVAGVPFSNEAKAGPYLPTGSFEELDYWRLVRQNFHINDNLIYLNNGTLGPSPVSVEQSIMQSITNINSNLRYGVALDVREDLAQLLGADESEISMTHNTTEGINVAVWGLPLSKGDEVIMSRHEHVGNALPWINRAKIDGIKIKAFYPPNSAAGVLNSIEDLITPRTKVISVPHISCTIGQRFPVKEICDLARSKGIYTVIDGAHGAGALALDVEDMGADIYVSCGHKWLLGPKGTGFLYVRKEMLEEVTPKFVGAYTDIDFDIMAEPPSFKNYVPTAHRYDYGTQNPSLRFGLKAACEFNLQIGAQKVQERIFGLSEYLREQLLEIDSIEMLSSNEIESRSMMLGFRSKKRSSKEVYERLIDARIRIRQVPEAGLNSLRVSTHVYNSESELDLLVDTLKAMA